MNSECKSCHFHQLRKRLYELTAAYRKFVFPCGHEVKPTTYFKSNKISHYHKLNIEMLYALDSLSRSERLYLEQLLNSYNDIYCIIMSNALH